MWSGWQSYAEAMKNVIGLTGLDCWEKHDAYKDCALYGGFRVMHEEFCIVSDFPEVIKHDDQYRPHCDTGPSHRWRDGFEIYHIHGVKVDKRIVIHPETITIDEIKSESNQEVRRIMIERMGVDKYLSETNAKILDVDMRGVSGAGARCLIQDSFGQQWFVGTDGSTERVYHMAVSNVKTCKEAHEQLCGFDEKLIKMEG